MDISTDKCVYIDFCYVPNEVSKPLHNVHLYILRVSNASIDLCDTFRFGGGFCEIRLVQSEAQFFIHRDVMTRNSKLFWKHVNRLV